MNLLNSLRKASFDLYSSLKRFPAAIGLCAATAILMIIKQELLINNGYRPNDMLSRIIMAVALGIPLALCIKLFFERKETVKFAARVLTYTSGAILIILYYIFLLKDLKMVATTRYTAFSLALYLAFLFIPYFYKKENFELYTIKIFIRSIITLFYSGVLFAGLSAIIFTINKLLSVYVPGKTYQYVWILIAGIFSPSYFLAGIPAFSHRLDLQDYSKILRILVLYIVMPLITAYTVILYLFFAKSLITQDWPVGWVAHLVIWYSVISTAVIFMITPLTLENRWCRIFTYWYTKLVLPTLIIMFASIGIRVRAYGITENRYFLIMLGLWVFGIMIYLNLAKRPRNINMLISLAIIAVISVSAPAGAYYVSKFSQNNRLENILKMYDMIKDGTIVKPNGEVSETDKNEVSQILKYFSNSHSFNDVKYLPGDFNFDNMESIFGFTYQLNNGTMNNRYFSYFTDRSSRAIDIRGYDYLFDFRSYAEEAKVKEKDIEVKYIRQNQTVQLSVLISGKEVYNAPLTDFIKQLRKKYPVEKGSPTNPDEMTLTESNDKLDIKIFIYNVDGEETGKDTIFINGMEFNVLIKVK